jgi:serine protease Do
MMLTGAAVLAIVAGGFSGGCHGSEATNSNPPLAAIPATQEIAQERRSSITRAVERVAPAVVSVQTEVLQRVAATPFDMFFGRQSAERITPGIGSGFIIRGDGVILTNAHVIANATSISVALRDGTTYPATSVGLDEANDLAVLRIDARDLPVAPLGSSDNLLLGEWAVAIGNPYGFLLGNTEPSVTAGVISGTGRNLVGGGDGGGIYVDMIQTDASINPGNSGGPLVNALGEVIGVNSSIYSPTGGSIGIGFAIPIVRARRIAEELLTHGAVRRPWLGIQPVRPRAENPRDVLRSGVVVEQVAPGSPAAEAGIRVGDELLRAGERQLLNPFDWQTLLADLRVGDRVIFRARRAGREFDATLTVADLPDVTAEKVEVLREIQLVTLTPAIRIERRIRSSSGAVIFSVSQRVARELGVQEGDVIVGINNVSITSAEEARRAIEAFGGRGAIRMHFERNGQIYYTDFVIRG